MNNILTCALPYANGNLHIGHFFEATCADIKSRYLKKQNIHCYFVSGDDCHGAATTLYCQKHNLDVSDHLKQQYNQHKSAYQSLKINFDNFSQTNIELHHKVVHWCVENILNYEKKQNIRLFETKPVQSWFDPKTSQFLPDRYVKGQCPHCKALEQTPEICEQCNTSIESHLLINPISVLTQYEVELKSSLHLTLNTQGFYEELLNHETLFHDSIKGKILDATLCSKEHIDISRDGPYYGIEITEFENLENQFFYVWFDAPLGYLTFSYECWLSEHNIEADKENFNNFVAQSTLEHFIGKDIAYFHSFLWINLLKFINEKATIDKIHFHGWLTLDKVKFSKSKGHSLDLSKLNTNQIDALRLYFFSKHDESIQDVEFLEEEVSGIYNQIIVKGLANFYARSIKIAHNNDISITFTDKLDSSYSSLLNEGDYKKLFLLLSSHLKDINSEFQELALWNQTDKTIIGNYLQIILQKWFDIYQVFCLICPELDTYRELIYKNEFIHLSKTLDSFSLFNNI